MCSSKQKSMRDESVINCVQFRFFCRLVNFFLCDIQGKNTVVKNLLRSMKHLPKLLGWVGVNSTLFGGLYPLGDH